MSSQPARSNSSPSSAVEAFDAVALSILGDFQGYIEEKANEAVNRITDILSKFVNEEAVEALNEFQSLYSEQKSMNSVLEDINKDVDDIFKQVEQQLSSGDGKSVNAEVIKEDETLATKRLSISAFQKRLESLVSLDDGVRKKLLPAVWSMQLEDITKNRIEAVVKSWQLVIDHQKQLSSAKQQTICSEIESSLKNYEDLCSFYKIVLKRTPPEKKDEQETVFDAFFEKI